MAVRRLLSTARHASTRHDRPLPRPVLAGVASDLLSRRHHGRGRLAVMVALSGALVAGVVTVPPLAQAAPDGPGSGSGEKSVPVSPIKARTEPPPPMPAWKATGRAWPAGGVGVVPVDTGAAGAAGKAVPPSGADFARPGGLGVRARAGVDAPEAARTAGELRSQLAPPPSSVRVQVWDRAAAEAVGIPGVVFTVSRADGRAGAGRVAFDVDYSTFEHMFGADFGARLRLVSLPRCVHDTPDLPQCRKVTPIAGARNVETEKVVSIDGFDIGSPSGSDPQASDPQAEDPQAEDPGEPTGSGDAVFAVMSGGSSSAGDFTKTPLSPSFSWAAGEQSGGFSTSVPITVPPGLGGPVPDVRLTYSSASVDTMTIATNSQASWVGTGWDLSLGSIERSYASCSDDGTPKGDLCWMSGGGQLAEVTTLTLNGTSTRLVRNDSNGVWRAEADSGWKIEQLSGTPNNSTFGEYWKVTTLDGTQYYFGQSKRAGIVNDRDTLAAQVVPVYGNNPGEPCYDTVHGSYANSFCWQVYKWNLDFVVDPRGNSMRIFYNKSAASYSRNNGQAVTYYEYNAVPQAIEYGYRATDTPSSSGQMRVEFTTDDRCNADGCQVDVPWDQFCAQAAPSCPHTSPTFFTPYGLDHITTKVWNNDAGAYQDVDRYDLVHSYPGTTDGTTASLWLSTLTHTGIDGAATASEPTLEFWGDLRDNRVDYNTGNGVPPLKKWRLGYILDNAGSRTVVSYNAGDCTAATLPDPDNNTKRCFPEYFTMNGSSGWGWFHKYTVSAVTAQDLTGGSPDEVWNYTYSTQGSSTNVLWGHDNTETVPVAKRTWSVFRGYSTVSTVHGATGGTRTESARRYFRGLNGDRTDAGDGTRTATISDSQGNVFPDVLPLAGRAREDMTIESGAIIGTVLHDLTPAVTSVRTRTYQGGNINAYYVWETKTQGKTKINATGGWRSTETQTSFDDYSLPYQVVDRGDTATTNDDVCHRTEYARDTTPYFIATASRTTTRAGTDCDAGALLEHSRVYYDGQTTVGGAPTQGLITKSENLVATGPDVWAVRETTFDVYGRATSGKDARGKTSTVTYTPATVLPPTQVVTAGPLGHTLTTTVDPRRGLPLTVADPNGRTTTGQYDPLGRLTKVWKPGHPTSGTPTAEYSYNLSLAGNNVVTKVIGPNGNQITSYEVFDGRLRPRQTQEPAPQANGGRIISDVAYDSRGLAVKSSTFWNSAAPDATLVAFADANVATQSRRVFDQQERVINDQFWSNNVLKWQSTMGYDGDRTMVTPPTGGVPTTAFFDVDGRATSVRHHLGATTAAPYQTSSYSYDRQGRRTQVTDPAGNVWTTGYDFGGRVTTSTDPDTGTSTSTYNAAGDVLTTTDARTITLAYKYDDLGRKSELWQGAVGTGTKRASWDYDTLAGGGSVKGLLVKSTRWVGSAAYSNEVISVDDSYRPLSAKVTLPSTLGALAGPWITSTTYKPDGQVATQTLPAAGSLPAETLTYTFDDAGYPLTVSGLDAYISATGYTNRGQPKELTLGVGTKRLQLEKSIDEATQRTTEKRVSTENQTTPNTWVPQLIEQYGYDDAGNVKNITEVTGTGSVVSNQCFGYDALRQLTEAWTTTASACQTTPTQAVVGGPDPYWTSYTYNSIGNRTTDTIHTPGGNTTRTYTYPASGPTSVRPHAATGVTITGVNPGSDTYGYDATGNATTRNLAGKPGQTLTWDPEGHLQSVADSNGTTSYLYTADGARLLASEPGAVTTLYLGGFELRSSPTGTICTRFYGVASRTTGSGLTWTSADHHGTGQVAIDPTTLAVTRRKTDPFGNQRGPAAAWPTTRGFVNGTQDATGLVHLGAREYEPAAGRFISVDPIMDTADPLQWNGYAYANSNPTTRSDPSGLLSIDNIGAFVAGFMSNFSAQAAQERSKKQAQAFREFVKDPKGTVKKIIEKKHKWQSKGASTPAAWTCALTNWCDETESAIVAIQKGDYYDAGQHAGAVAQSVIEVGLAIASIVGGALGVLDVVVTLVTTAVKTVAKIVSKVVKKVTKAAGEVDVPSPGGGGHSTGSAGSGCHSFDPDTPVRMADGTEKPIKDVKIGDIVQTTDPHTGQTIGQPVTATHNNLDNELTNVTVTLADGTAHTIETTPSHPFWAANAGRWIDAGNLTVGTVLLTPDGKRVVVAAVRTFAEPKWMRDLTVEQFHTYYVLAGPAPVLVHNCGEAIVHLDPDAKHALITVTNGDEVLHTEQFGGVNIPTNGVREFDPATLSPNAINVRIPLPNPGGAMAYAEVMMARTARGQYPDYNLATQSCVTYCAQVLRAGGVSDVPTRTVAATRWLLERHG